MRPGIFNRLSLLAGMLLASVLVSALSLAQQTASEPGAAGGVSSTATPANKDNAATAEKDKTGEPEPGAIDLTQLDFDNQGRGPEYVKELQPLRELSGEDEFNRIAQALEAVFTKAAEQASAGQDGDAKTISSNTTRQVVIFLSGLDPKIRKQWGEKHNELLKRFKDNHEGGFDPEKIVHWKRLYEFAARVLQTARTGSASPAAATVAKAFSESEFSDKVFERLKALDVIRFDHSFEKTCLALIKEIDSLLATADQEKWDAAKLRDEGLARIATIIVKSNIGPVAKKQWHEAITEFMGRLEPLAFTVTDWRHAFTQVKSGLEKSIKLDKEFIAELMKARGFRTPSEAGMDETTYGTMTGGGGAVAAVWHERMMNHIYRTHDRRIYRSVRIRSRR